MLMDVMIEDAENIREKAVENQQVKKVNMKKDLLAEGRYKAMTRAAIYQKNIPAKDNLVDVVDVEFKVYIYHDDYGSIEKRALKERYFISAASGSKFNQHLGKILGRDARHGFNTHELLGIPVKIEVKHNHSNGRTFANINSLWVLNTEKLKEEI